VAAREDAEEDVVEEREVGGGWEGGALPAAAREAEDKLDEVEDSAVDRTAEMRLLDGSKGRPWRAQAGAA
jgi:hypothetical protein